ncbi:MAG: sigma-54-dependent transcriptional regulator [Woeseia sp.]
MTKLVQLRAPDREFLRELTEVVFDNPFSSGRMERIARLAPGWTLEELARDRQILAGIVTKRLHPYTSAGIVSCQQFAVEDQRLIEPALLYEVYIRAFPQFDRLIEQQAHRGGAPARVSFADEVLGQLAGRGFPETQATRYFAFFFQVRRAFFFLERLLVGDSSSMRRLRFALWNNVFTHNMRNYERVLWNRMEDFSTLLLGETGTGKGSAAAAIGRSGFIPYLAEKRCFAVNFAETFIAINLSQFPESLIESELFGHRKGAFTGAIDHHQGLFELCSPHGALFLDEIGEVGVPVQIKLLQVLQERVFTPLGSHDKRRFAGRVIAATNRSLAELRSAERFRNDFYYRLCSDVITVPTLRQRIDEWPAELEQLVNLLVERMAGEPGPNLSEKVLETLGRNLPQGYAWPGNVRELEQAVRRVLLTGSYEGDLRTTDHSSEDAFLESVRAGALTADELIGRYCAMLHERHPNYSDVASRAGLDRRTVRKHVLRFGRQS